MKCQILYPGKNKKKIFQYSSAENFPHNVIKAVKNDKEKSVQGLLDERVGNKIYKGCRVR